MGFDSIVSVLVITLCGFMVVYSDHDSSQIPNIIFFITDDWGFNDVGFHQNTKTQTPFIDYLAQKESLIIAQHYVQPLCTPTRAALLTGRYPMRYGLHDGAVTLASPFGLSQYEYLLSSEFKLQGYSTHAVGKWHLGHLTWDYTPTYRGFDTFKGYYGGSMSYENHTASYDDMQAYDLRFNTEKYNEPDTFSLYIYRDHILALLEDISDQSKRENGGDKPFFLYVGWQGSHTPSEAEDEYLDIYSSGLTSTEYDDTYSRLVFQAQTTETDAMFKSIVSSLKSQDIWDNTLLIFFSDNGGVEGKGDNSPLRGGKSTLWEGGIRVPAFVTGGWLPTNQRGKTLTDYPIHVTDWYPTVLAAAGVDVNSINELDGKNMWSVIAGTEDELDDSSLESIGSDRTILVNVDSYNCQNDVCGSVIYGGKWKLMITNNQFIESKDDVSSCFWERTFELSTDDILGCDGIPDDVDTSECSCKTTVCLFNLEDDPCEYYDVSEEYPELASSLYAQLTTYYNEQAEQLYDYFDDLSSDIIDPNTNVDTDDTDDDLGWWGPFYDAEDYQIDTLEFEILLSKYYDNDDNDDNRHIKNDISIGNPIESEQAQNQEHKQKKSVLSLLSDKLVIGIGIVVIFGPIVACIFGCLLKRYVLKKKRKSTIFDKFLEEGQELSGINEYSPLVDVHD